MHVPNASQASRWREPYSKAALESSTKLPKSDSFESLLSLNMLASSLLDEATDLEEISQDRHITLPYFSTQVIGSQPYRFSSGADKGDKGKGVTFEAQEASFSSGKPREPKRRFGHNRQDSSATTASSVPGSHDYDSFLSRSTATHSTKNTSYGSYAAFAKPGDSSSYLPPTSTQRIGEHTVMSSDLQARRLSAVESVHGSRPFSSLATVAGIQEEDTTHQNGKHTPRSPTASKIGDWLRQQYEAGARSLHSTPSSASVSTYASPLQASDDGHLQPSSSKSSPATEPYEPQASAETAQKPTARARVHRRSSQQFRRALLEEIIETDFADAESPPRPPSRDLLWHPSEYVGPIRRSKTTTGPSRPANHRRHRSADLLQEAKLSSNDDSEKRQSWLANTFGRASMNDLLLRPANDPTRQSAENGIKSRGLFSSFGKGKRRPSHGVSRSLSNLSSFLGFKSSPSSASISPPGISSNGTFVVHNHQHPRTRTPSFVVHSRSPPPQSPVNLPKIDNGDEYDKQALASPISLTSEDSQPSSDCDTPRSKESHNQYQATLTRYRRSLKRFTSTKRQPRAEAFQVSERRKAETGRLAELAQEQVARDANVRAQIVDRFTSPLRRKVEMDGA